MNWEEATCKLMSNAKLEFGDLVPVQETCLIKQYSCSLLQVKLICVFLGGRFRKSLFIARQESSAKEAEEEPQEQ